MRKEKPKKLLRFGGAKLDASAAIRGLEMLMEDGGDPAVRGVASAALGVIRGLVASGSTGAPLGQPTPEDTKRLDHLEAWLDGFEWVHLPTQIEPEVRCDWFAGDGSGHWFTQGKTFREAIDKSLNHEATQESHD